MPIRCSYCSHSFNLSRDYVAAALAEALAQKHKTHAVDCPNCRKHIKVPVAQMKRYAPTASESESEQVTDNGWGE